MRRCSRCSIQSSQRRTARCCALEPDTPLRLAEGFSLIDHDGTLKSGYLITLDVRLWHKVDVRSALMNVRFEE